MFDELEFESDEETRTSVPDGTVAPVKLRRDRETGEFRFDNTDVYKSGRNQGKSWLKLDFEVADGDYQGRWASIFLTVDTKDYSFRKTVETVTGLDLSQGGVRLDFEDFKSKLSSGVFNAELGPEKRKNPDTNEYEETGYTRVKKLLSRVGERDEAAEANASADPVVAVDDTAPAADDDEIPF